MQVHPAATSIVIRPTTPEMALSGYLSKAMFIDVPDADYK